MSTISEKLVRLAEYKQDIKEAINDKGVSVQDNMSTYADAIREISSGVTAVDIDETSTPITHRVGYPDTDNLQTEHNCLYLVIDNRDRKGWYAITPIGSSTARYNLEHGHFDNNQFVVDEVVATGVVSSNYGRSLGHLDYDYPMVRIKQQPSSYAFNSWYIPIANITIDGVARGSANSTIVELIADIDLQRTVTSYYGSCYCMEKMTLKNVPNTCTGLINLCYNGYNLRELKSVNCDFSNVTNVQGLFYNCYTIQDINVGEMLGPMPKVTSAASIFSNCFSVKHIDVSALAGSKPATLSTAFNACYSLESIDGLNTIDVSNITTLLLTFNTCWNLKSLDLSLWTITSKCTTMSNTFYQCYNLESLKIGTWDVSSVQMFTTLFYLCYSLVFDADLTAKLEAWRMGNSAQMGQMFQYCLQLTKLDCSGWQGTFNGLFNNCRRLKRAALPQPQADLTKISLDTTFNSCHSLEEVDFSHFRKIGVTSLNSTFANCYSLKSVDLSWITSLNECVSCATTFLNCASLEEVVFPEAENNTMPVCSTYASMFQGCRNIKRIVFPFRNTTLTTVTARYFADQCYVLQNLVTDLDCSIIPSNPITWAGCYPIENVTYGIPPKVNTVLYYNYLTRECLLKIINDLPVVTSTRTLTLHMNRLKLTAEELAVATNKGWTIA